MNINGSTSTTLHIVYVEPDMTEQALADELYTLMGTVQQPVLLVLPEKPVQILRRPDDFLFFRRLKRQLGVALFFVIPASQVLRMAAKRYGFITYRSQEECAQNLERDLRYFRNGLIITGELLTPEALGLLPGSPQLLPPAPPMLREQDAPAILFSERSPQEQSNPRTNPPLPLWEYVGSGSKELDVVRVEEKHTLKTQEPVLYPPSLSQIATIPHASPSQPIHTEVPHPLLDTAASPRTRFPWLVQDKRTGIWVATLLVTLLVLVSILPLSMLWRSSQQPRVLPASASALGIGVTKTAGGETIGLSDGRFPFDLESDRPDRALKIQAADKLKAGDIGSAQTLWHSATQMDSNDAEALIYLENQRVLSSGYPYITIVVATMLSGTYVGLGRDDIQGAYVAQKIYNAGYKLSGGLQLRLLIANSGNERDSATPVARQIVEAAKKDKTIVGVMGWPYSSRCLNAVPILTEAHIPILTQMASSVVLHNISPDFFRIVQPDSTQAQAGALFVEQNMHAKAAALFIDPSEAYSASIGNAFREKFLADGNQIVATENYTVGKPETLPGLLQEALKHNPEVIYFAGMATDASTLLVNLPTSGPFANLNVVGGDGLYELHGYSDAARPNFHRLRFTAFAYPDEWTAQGLKQPDFFQDYANAFDPFHQHASNPYGYSRTGGDTILSYDAVMVMLEAANLFLGQNPGQQQLTPDNLRQGLTQITGSHSIQGVSGQISFGSDNEPINKTVVVLGVDQNGHIQMVGLDGQFLRKE